MPLPGGPSDKYGNRFEGKWTAYCLSRIMAEEEDSIWIEPPGAEGEGCEFLIRSAGSVTRHQVKRQHSHCGPWGMGDLERNGVLDAAFKHTSSPDAHFCFVSAVSAEPLAELINAAESSKSLSAFESEFLKGQRQEAWTRILSYWRPRFFPVGQSDAAALKELVFERLPRIQIRTIDEATLAELIEAKLRSIVRGDSSRLRHDLCAIAIECVHKELNADEIWRQVAQRGYSRADYARDGATLASVEALNARYLPKQRLIGKDIDLVRDEAELALQILRGDTGKTSVLVSGDAGVGKTVVLGQIVKKVQEAGLPLVYFRIDRLNPTELPQNVGAQLGLMASPAEILAGIAKGRQAVLIIDQLDAVSTASGRNPGFFDCIHEIIRQTAAFPNLRLVLACRKFDLEKDNRFRELVSETGPAREVQVQLLTPDVVKGVLARLGCPPNTMPERQIELLRLPLHLAMFAEVLGKCSSPRVRLLGTDDLFKEFWNVKRLATEERLKPESAQWTEVLDFLCDRMTAHQVLFVPETEIFDQFNRTAAAMLSEGVLAVDGGHVSLFHETFFDYAFARMFSRQGRDLIQFLKDGEQHLFKRAPMRQILAHVHAADEGRFADELGRILADPGIRFHLKKCALEVTGKLNCASAAVWALFEPVLRGPDIPLQRQISGVFFAAVAWFPFLLERGVLEAWLASGSAEERNRAMWIIQHHILSFPGESVGLLTPHVGASKEMNGAILFAIWNKMLAQDRRVFDLFMGMVERELVEDKGNHDFWMCIHELPDLRPDWAAEAIVRFLRVKTARLDLDAEARPWCLLGSDGGGERAVHEVAEKSPSSFVRWMLPLFVELMLKTAIEDQSPGCLRNDWTWHPRLHRESHLSLDEAILFGLVAALRSLATQSPAEFESAVSQLLPHGDYDSAHFLIIMALSVAPAEYADRSVAYVLGNHLRLECGWPSPTDRCLAAREFVSHIGGACTDGAFRDLEHAVLGYYPRWERKAQGLKDRGYWQHCVLPALPGHRTGTLTKARIGELQRKFPTTAPVLNTSRELEEVPPPVPESAAARMRDDNWLEAIQKYSSDRSRVDRARGLLGGAHGLSGLLEKSAKAEAERFARLGMRLSPETHPLYFQALARGLKDSGLSRETTFEVVRMFHAIPNRPAGHWSLGLIGQFDAEDVPDDVLHILGWLATEDPDPTEDRERRHSASKEKDRAYELLGTAINSVRGTAAEVIGSLLFQRRERIPVLMPYLEKMVRDPTMAVRATTACALLGLYRHDESAAVDLFLRLVDGAQDILLATHHVDRFLYHANFHHFSRLQPLLARMLASTTEIVRETGARHVCLSQFEHPDAISMVAACLQGDEALRMGAARVAEANLFHDRCADFCHPTLSALFNDPAKAVRDEAAGAFRRAEGRQLGECRDLLRAFLRSAAFVDNVNDLTWAMERSTAEIDEEITLLCEASLQAAKDPANRASRLAFSLGSVAGLLMRSYRQVRAPAFKSRCLDLIDGLLMAEKIEITAELEQFER